MQLDTSIRHFWQACQADKMRFKFSISAAKSAVEQLGSRLSNSIHTETQLSFRDATNDFNGSFWIMRVNNQVGRSFG
jgi:hypothetical protein